MAVQPIYNTGTATVTAGSATVTGLTTAWQLALVNGGTFTKNGLGIPIVDVPSDTELTLAYVAPADMAGTGPYAISLGRADAASAIVANRALADLTQLLSKMVSPFWRSVLDDPDGSAILSQTEAIAALAMLEVNADKLPYFNGVDTAAVTDFTAYARQLLSATNAVDARNQLGSISFDEVNQALSTSNLIATKRQFISVGSSLTGDRPSSIDLHSAGTDSFEARIIRESGVNGKLTIDQTGTGPIDIVGGSQFLRNGKKQWRTLAEYDLQVTPTGFITQVFNDTDSFYKITYGGISNNQNNSSILLNCAEHIEGEFYGSGYVDTFLYGYGAGNPGIVSAGVINPSNYLVIGLSSAFGISSGTVSGYLGGKNGAFSSISTYFGYDTSVGFFNSNRMGYFSNNYTRKPKILISSPFPLNAGSLVIEAM